MRKGGIFLAIQYLLDMTMNGFYYDKRKIHILLPISRLVAYHHYHSNIFFTDTATYPWFLSFFPTFFLFLYILFCLAFLTYAYGRTTCRATSYLDIIFFFLLTFIQ